MISRSQHSTSLPVESDLLGWEASEKMQDVLSTVIVWGAVWRAGVSCACPDVLIIGFPSLP